MFSVPKPIKIEDEIDLDDYKTSEDLVLEWDASIKKLFKNCCVAEDDGKLKYLMREYIISLTTKASSLEDINTLTKVMLCHIHFLYSYYSEFKSYFNESYYLENMEEILTIFSNKEIVALKSLKKKNKHEYKRQCRLTTRRIIYALTTYLLNVEEHIFHVLIKLNSWYSKDISNNLFKHFFVDKKRIDDLTDEAFCRGYIIFQKWKELCKPEQRPSMEALLYELYRRTPDSLQTNEIVRKILAPKNNTTLDVIKQFCSPVSDLSYSYFQYMTSKKHCENEAIQSILDSTDDEANASCSDDSDSESSRAYSDLVKAMSKLNQHLPPNVNNSSDRIKQEDEDDDVQIISVDLPNLRNSEVVCVIDDDSNDPSDDVKIVYSVEPKKVNKMARRKERRKPMVNTPVPPVLSFLDSIQITIPPSLMNNEQTSMDTSPPTTVNDTIVSSRTAEPATTTMNTITVCPQTVDTHNNVTVPPQNSKLTSSINCIAVSSQPTEPINTSVSVMGTPQENIPSISLSSDKSDSKCVSITEDRSSNNSANKEPVIKKSVEIQTEPPDSFIELSRCDSEMDTSNANNSVIPTKISETVSSNQTELHEQYRNIKTGSVTELSQSVSEMDTGNAHKNTILSDSVKNIVSNNSVIPTKISETVSSNQTELHEQYRNLKRDSVTELSQSISEMDPVNTRKNTILSDSVKPIIISNKLICSIQTEAHKEDTNLNKNKSDNEIGTSNSLKDIYLRDVIPTIISDKLICAVQTEAQKNSMNIQINIVPEFCKSNASEKTNLSDSIPPDTISDEAVTSCGKPKDLDVRLPVKSYDLLNNDLIIEQANKNDEEICRDEIVPISDEIICRQENIANNNREITKEINSSPILEPSQSHLCKITEVRSLGREEDLDDVEDMLLNSPPENDENENETLLNANNLSDEISPEEEARHLSFINSPQTKKTIVCKDVAKLMQKTDDSVEENIDINNDFGDTVLYDSTDGSTYGSNELDAILYKSNILENFEQKDNESIPEPFNKIDTGQKFNNSEFPKNTSVEKSTKTHNNFNTKTERLQYINGSKTLKLPLKTCLKEVRINVIDCNLEAKKNSQKSPETGRIVFTSEGTIKSKNASLEEFSKFELINQNKLQGYQDFEDYNSSLSGPLSQYNGATATQFDLYDLDENLDIFNSQSSEPVSKSLLATQNHKTSHINILNSPGSVSQSDIASPTYEGIADFKIDVKEFFTKPAHINSENAKNALNITNKVNTTGILKKPFSLKSNGLINNETSNRVRRRKITFNNYDKIKFIERTGEEPNHFERRKTNGIRRIQEEKSSIVNVCRKSLQFYHIKLDDPKLQCLPEVVVKKLSHAEVIRGTMRGAPKRQFNEAKNKQQFIRIDYDKTMNRLSDQDTVFHNELDTCFHQTTTSYRKPLNNSSPVHTVSGLSSGNAKQTVSKKRGRPPGSRNKIPANSKRKKGPSAEPNSKKNTKDDFDELLKSSAYYNRPFRLDIEKL